MYTYYELQTITSTPTDVLQYPSLHILLKNKMGLNHFCRGTPCNLVSFAATLAGVMPRACVTPEGDNICFKEKIMRERL